MVRVRANNSDTCHNSDRQMPGVLGPCGQQPACRCYSNAAMVAKLQHTYATTRIRAQGSRWCCLILSGLGVGTQGIHVDTQRMEYIQIDHARCATHIFMQLAMVLQASDARRRWA